ncbi:MAG: RdgB/HAM1 family non-canonical purine NTP pyrophosphatase [Candidatus Zixiibacteriota bacterium]
MKFDKLILATKNKHKVAEMTAMLADLGITILTRDDLEDFPDIEETGTTLEDNALLKSRIIYSHYGIPAVADDTGLEVEYLNGAPGVYSARYAGPNCNFEDNNRKLLKELADVSFDRRMATFATVIAVSYKGGDSTHRGEVNGVIADSMMGVNGFGYDPVFFYPPLQKTYAQMTIEEKNRVSHRGRALSKFKDWLLAP